jgi:hypothetical protein
LSKRDFSMLGLPLKDSLVTCRTKSLPSFSRLRSEIGKANSLSFTCQSSSNSINAYFASPDVRSTITSSISPISLPLPSFTSISTSLDPMTYGESFSSFFAAVRLSWGAPSSTLSGTLSSAARLKTFNWLVGTAYSLSPTPRTPPSETSACTTRPEAGSSRRSLTSPIFLALLS